MSKKNLTFSLLSASACSRARTRFYSTCKYTTCATLFLGARHLSALVSGAGVVTLGECAKLGEREKKKTCAPASAFMLTRFVALLIGPCQRRERSSGIDHKTTTKNYTATICRIIMYYTVRTIDVLVRIVCLIAAIANRNQRNYIATGDNTAPSPIVGLRSTAKFAQSSECDACVLYIVYGVRVLCKLCTRSANRVCPVRTGDNMMRYCLIIM